MQAFVQLTCGLFLPLSIRYVLEPPYQGFETIQPGEGNALTLWATIQMMAVVLVGTASMALIFVWPIVHSLACSKA
jgi:hypothetical protein